MPKELTPEQLERKRAKKRAYMNANYARYAEKTRQRAAKWYLNNKERAKTNVRRAEKARLAKITPEERDIRLAKRRARWAAKKEEMARKQAEYRASRNEQQREAHLERRRLRNRATYIRDAEKIKARVKRQKHVRRAQSYSCEGSFTQDEWETILKAHGNRCSYCGTKGTKEKPLTRDHYIALSKKGANKARNIVPACKSCNSSKNTKHPIDFMRSKGFLL